MGLRFSIFRDLLRKIDSASFSAFSIFAWTMTRDVRPSRSGARRGATAMIRAFVVSTRSVMHLLDVLDRYELPALLRQFDLAEVRVGAEQPHALFALADESPVERGDGFLFERALQVPDIPEHALHRVELPAAFLWQSRFHELVNTLHREVQSLRHFDGVDRCHDPYAPGCVCLAGAAR